MKVIPQRVYIHGELYIQVNNIKCKWASKILINMVTDIDTTQPSFNDYAYVFLFPPYLKKKKKKMT